MSQEFNLENFLQQRPIPDTGGRSFEEIYDELVKMQAIPSNLKSTMMDREIQLEIQNSYGIKEMLDKVEHGDLLISDMYLPGEAILQIAKAVGLDKQVTIYQSNGDKSSGKVWKQLKNKPPKTHYGDNPTSDIFQAKLNGINAQLFDKSKLTDIEKRTQIIGLLTREIRLRNSNTPAPKYFELATKINIPLLFVMLEQLHRKLKDKSIVFLGRDCQLMWKIYNIYYRTAYYLPFSRKVAYAQPELAAEYINKHSPKNSVLVDISSTGETWTHMSKYGNFDVISVIYGDNIERKYLPITFSYLTKNSVCGQTNLLLEVFNCGDHGRLDSLEKIGKVIQANFAEPELPDSIVRSVHLPVNMVLNLEKYYKFDILKQLRCMSDEQLAAWFKQLSSIICSNISLLVNLREFQEKETKYHSDIINVRNMLNT
jgi:hypothetical protein